VEEAPQPSMGCLGCLGRGLIVVFALIGFLQTTTRLFGPVLFDTIMSPLMVREVTKTVAAPGGATNARIEVTRGGFGTVWTTRIRLVPKGEEGWMIYQTKDSDFTPTLRWLDPTTLLLGLGCERFGHISNPDDWESVSESRPRRYKVRVYYSDKRCAPNVDGSNAP
jgi:hypothetical protein